MAVNFTETEWLILSSIGYAVNSKDSKNYDKASGNLIDGKDKLKVEDLLEKLEKKATGGKELTDLENYTEAIKSLKEKLKGYVVSKFSFHNKESESGFVALAIEPVPNNEKDVIVCCRGSDSLDYKNMNDWTDADLALLANEMNEQQYEMHLFMNDINDYNNIYLTGHSLGGNLSMYGAIIYDEPEKIKNVYSFDGPGFNDEFIKIYKDKINSVKNKIMNFQNEYDAISSAFNSVGKVNIICFAYQALQYNKLTQIPFIGHERFAFKADASGNLVRNGSGKKSTGCNVFHTLSKKLSYAYNFRIGNRTHNFSSANCERVINLLDDFDNIKFSRLNDWNNYSGYAWFLKSTALSVKKHIEQYYSEIDLRNHYNKGNIDKVFEKINSTSGKFANLLDNTTGNTKALNDKICNALIDRIK